MLDIHIEKAAETALGFLRTHAAPVTPKNYEVAFAYAVGDPAALTERLRELQRTGSAITAGILDRLHYDFLGNQVDVLAVRDGSQELGQIATELATQVGADRAIVDSMSTSLARWAAGVKAMPLPAGLAQATATLSDATSFTSDRLRGMEQLLAASLGRIAELKQKLAKAEHDATRDGLTGLLNRRAFDIAIHEFAEQQTDRGQGMTLLILDIDHFKRINDTYGHPVGDHVLRLFARVLREHIKGRDVAARYGGEEFAVILPNTSLAGARTVAEQLRSLLERAPIVNRLTGQRLGVVTCSVGVAMHRIGEAAIDVINRADRALYRAKQTGRNRVLTEQDLDGSG